MEAVGNIVCALWQAQNWKTSHQNLFGRSPASWFHACHFIFNLSLIYIICHLGSPASQGTPDQPRSFCRDYLLPSSWGTLSPLWAPGLLSPLLFDPIPYFTICLKYIVHCSNFVTLFHLPDNGSSSILSFYGSLSILSFNTLLLDTTR